MSDIDPSDRATDTMSRASGMYDTRRSRVSFAGGPNHRPRNATLDALRGRAISGVLRYDQMGPDEHLSTVPVEGNEEEPYPVDAKNNPRLSTGDTVTRAANAQSDRKVPVKSLRPGAPSGFGSNKSSGKVGDAGRSHELSILPESSTELSSQI